VHAYRNVLASLLLLLTVLCGASVEAKSLLRITCDDPKGTEMSYGRGLLGLWELKMSTATAEYPGAQPLFLLDEDQPQQLQVTWGSPPSVQETGQTQARTFDASVLSATEDRITAVHQSAEAVWMYSLFPKLGIGYFSTHNHIPFGYTSRSVSTYALCQFTRDEK
jgi:hypothetical protein